MARILRDPTPADGGGTATPAATPPPAPQAQAPATVQLPVDQLQSLLAMRAEFDRMRAEQQQQQDAAARQITDAQAKAGKIEEALQNERKQASEKLEAEKNSRTAVERRAMNYARDTSLATALAGHKLRPGVAPQLMALLRDGLETAAEGETYTVRTPLNSASPLKSAPDYVAEMLARPEYAHFLEPTGSGGSGAGGPQSPPASGEQRPPSEGEQIMARYNAARNPANVPDWTLPAPAFKRA